MRINALGNTATDFASDDYIALDGTTNGSRKMKNDSLLKVTAQNAIAGNVAPSFDPTRDNTNPYKAGESVTYEGKTYTFKVSHYGAWASADVEIRANNLTCHRVMSSAYLAWSDMSISGTGWTSTGGGYQKRVCLWKDNPLHLNAGDLFFIDVNKLTQAPTRMYLGIRDNNGSYTYRSWTTYFTFIAQFECDIVFLVEYANTITTADINELGNAIYSSTSNSQVDSIAYSRQIKDYVMEKGTYDFYHNNYHYQNHNHRIRTLEQEFVYFEAGDIITVPNACSIYATYVGNVLYYNPNAVSNSGGFVNSSYTIPSSGYYLIQYQSNPISIILENSLNVTVLRGENKYSSPFLPSSKEYEQCLNFDFIHIGFNANFVSGEIPAIAGHSNRCCVFPTNPIKVLKDDVLVVNTPSTFFSNGVYLQLIKSDGTSVQRSWSTSNYIVPNDGDLYLLAEFVGGLTDKQKENAVLNAFSLNKKSLNRNLAMGNVDKLKTDVKPKSALFTTRIGVAHRGLEQVAPENTLPAFRAAANAGFKWVECDVILTADDVPVICHDRTIDRTSDGSGRVDSYTLSQLREFDFGSWFSPLFAGTPIPTLEDLLKCCSNLGVGVVIDFSNTGTPALSKLHLITDLIVKYRMLDKVMLVSLAYNAIASKLFPEGFLIPICCIDVEDYTSSDFVSFVNWNKRGYPIVIGCSYTDIDNTVRSIAENNKIPINTYTLTSASSLDSIVSEDSVQYVTQSYTTPAEEYYKSYEIAKSCTDL